MNNISKKQACSVPVGTVIVGKWHKNKYKIKSLLGKGATGSVYLSESPTGLVAVKISDSSMSISSEVNVLKHFLRVRRSYLGPSLLDVDDWERRGFDSPTAFYVMEYIKGEALLQFIKRRGNEWIGILCLQLLAELDILHREGWVFGDLKPDNLLVTAPPPKIRLLDVGGTTLIGRSIKEFTEFFDRGYWGKGSRKAEPSYDLFAVAMIIINIAYPNRFSRSRNGGDELKNAIKSNVLLRKYSTVLENAIEGKYSSASNMRKDLLLVMNQQYVSNKQTTTNQSIKSSSISNRRKGGKRSKKKSFLEFTLLFLVIIVVYWLYIYSQLL
ncbi:protein kinase domain-containing protein [Cytobacillus sp. Hm23]